MVSVVHRRVRADLPETYRLYGPLNCATIGNTYFLSSAIFLPALDYSSKMTCESSKVATSTTLICLVFYSLLRSHLRVSGAV